MTLLVLKLRPWSLFFSREVRFVISSSAIKTQTYVFKHFNLCSRPIYNPVQRLAHHTLKTKNPNEGTEELYFENDTSAEDEPLTKRAISNIQQIFRIKPKIAEALVSKYPALKSVSLKNAQRNIQYFTDKGLSLETLIKNPWLLTYKIETITSKLEIISKLNLGDINIVFPLLQLSLHHLQKNLEAEEKENVIIPQGNRINYTSEKLECSVAEVCKVFGQHKFLHYVQFDRYSYIMEKLIDAGVSPLDILRDVWIFQYGIQNIDKRLAILKEVGVNPIKPWMLRSSPKIFEATLQRVSSRKKILGENSVIDYLTQQLECDVKTVDFIASKHPILLRKHVPKLKELFDFLYAEGFTPQQVIQVPRILFYKVESIKSRLTELRKAGCNPGSLMTLCKTKREFKKIMKVALKRKLQTLPDT